MFRKVLKLGLAAALALTLGMSSASADVLVTGSGTVQNDAVSASANFHVDQSGNLVITLTNTAADTPHNSAVLSNIEFNLNSGVSFSGAGSVVVGPGSALFNSGGQVGGAGTDISGGYGLGTNVTFMGTPQTQFGVSSVSFTSGNLVNGSPIGGGPFLGNHGNSLDGTDYGILANGADSGNNGITNNGPFAANSVVITLVSTGSAIDLSQLNSVFFSCGSEQVGVGGGFIPAVPAPPSVLLLGIGGLCLAAFLVRPRRRLAAAA
ncbi:MAG TPA: XDD4 family exosortase-dependent surface protein [Gemmataceae bacterium]